MLTPKEKAEYFRTLHVPGRPLVLFNIWDAGSAKAVAAAGARAIATGSWQVANANGYADGERVPLDFAIDNLFRIVQAVDVPVTVDLESGYGSRAVMGRLPRRPGGRLSGRFRRALSGAIWKIAFRKTEPYVKPQSRLNG
jgi:2-methylisocitrate lyase-like PEP mutase family enzyme